MGGEFQASDARGFVDEAPAVVGLPDGGFVVAYQSTKAGSGILAQRFDAGGTLIGTEFEAATNTSQGQSVPAAGQLADGGFILTWASNHLGAGSVREIYAQRFDSDANPVTRDGQTVGNDEFFVRAGDPFNFDGRVPSVTGLEGGGFVIALQDAGQLDGNGQGIFASVFDAAGTLVGGSEFVVNTTTGLNQSRPSVTALEGGGFVVTWDDDSGADGSALGVFGRIFDAAGNALGGEFQLNTFTAGNQATPSVVALGDGGFVAVWNSADQDGDTTGVFGQRFDGAGNPVGSEFQINTETTGSQNTPSAAALEDGGFVVSWQSVGQDGDANGVFAQRFDAEAQPLGPAVLTGGAGNDTLNLGADQVGVTVDLDGGTGDTLILGAGDNAVTVSNTETVLGGFGNDTVDLDAAATSTTVDLGFGNDALNLADGGNVVTVSNTESVTGGAGDDTVTVSGTQGALVDGGAGNDTLTGGEYLETTIVAPADGLADDIFGAGISISGDAFIVGAPLDDTGANTNQGAAYVYRFNGTTWVEEAKLTADDGADSDIFGKSVSISGNVALAGANSHDVNGIDDGAVYVYRFNGSTWTQEARLTASDGGAGDRFGISV